MLAAQVIDFEETSVDQRRIIIVPFGGRSMFIRRIQATVRHAPDPRRRPVTGVTGFNRKRIKVRSAVQDVVAEPQPIQIIVLFLPWTFSLGLSAPS